MIFKFTVTPYTAKIAAELLTTACFTTKWLDWGVFIMGLFADTASPPLVNIESFAPWQPPLTQLFWSSRDELEVCTLALMTL
jgi:hypothetical protein